MNKYYVYEWFNKLNDYVFYVGKDCKNRCTTMRGRNKSFLKYIEENACDYRIVKNNLLEHEALELERQTIAEYREKGFCCCNFDNGGLAFGEGEKNSQFGISPNKRMSKDVYDEWRQKQYLRKFGSKNPNYHNDTLHKKYLANPSLSLEKQSRPGVQNGRSLPIKMYDKTHKLIKEFPYIRECCKYLSENNYTKSKDINAIYTRIWKANKTNKTYLGFYFKY